MKETGCAGSQERLLRFVKHQEALLQVTGGQRWVILGEKGLGTGWLREVAARLASQAQGSRRAGLRTWSGTSDGHMAMAATVKSLDALLALPPSFLECIRNSLPQCVAPCKSPGVKASDWLSSSHLPGQLGPLSWPHSESQGGNQDSQRWAQNLGSSHSPSRPPNLQMANIQYKELLKRSAG